MSDLSEFNPRPFGKYFLLKELSVGKYTRVYKAKTYGAKGFEKFLILQQIFPSRQKQAFVTALTEEFKRVVKVTHPNVLPFYDFGCVKEQYFLTQEFLEGMTLAELMQKEFNAAEKFSAAECFYVMSEILKGLQAIHSRFKNANPLTHGHISPDTLFVSRDGEIKIMGLGYERLAVKFEISDKLDPNYSVETWQRTGVWDVTDDLRMCALVLFEMMVGVPLLTMLPEESGQTKITTEFLNHQFSGEILEFFKKSFSVEGQESFSTALDMAVSLQRILYSQFPEFSSQHWVERLQKYFENSESAAHVVLANSFILEDTLKELVKSSRDQVNLVHREGTEFSTLLSDTVALSPKDTTQFFLETQSIKSLVEPFQSEEKPLNPEELPQSNSPLVVEDDDLNFDIEEDASPNEELLFGKFSILDASRKSWIYILSGSFLVLILILFLVATQAPPVVEESQEPKRLASQYQLMLASEPSGANVWLNGKSTDQMTPASFLALENNKSYHIVVKKEGFEDFSTVLKNESGKDQMLNVTLRPK